MENEYVQKGDRVCELGSGLGLCAPAAVFATDGDLEAVRLLRLNIHKNDVSAVVSSEMLYWGHRDDILRLKTKILTLDESNAGKTMIFIFVDISIFIYYYEIHIFIDIQIIIHIFKFLDIQIFIPRYAEILFRSMYDSHD